MIFDAAQTATPVSFIHDSSLPMAALATRGGVSAVWMTVARRRGGWGSGPYCEDVTGPGLRHDVLPRQKAHKAGI
ncbi:hypothetical protein [Xanthobacter oligotrophicus]|uniref:hypothetical protein n=1 Tax=Xanthobacter oligotrophicus TaxID=2607286 RepID=UPI0011F18167|nr:hypothetical protein [Xanthobacter oligotrophicus]MCG5233680.1 hypothetical protein [Xanthobacter oligotrophicus]